MVKRLKPRRKQGDPVLEPSHETEQSPEPVEDNSIKESASTAPPVQQTDSERTKSKKKLQRSFMFFLLAGTLFLWACLYKFKIETHWSVVGSAGIMGLYWLWVGRELDKPMVREIFGDSFYYMGFLFTFIALLFAVIGLGQNISIETVVSSMGIALITTVIGLAVRVYYVQFEPIVNSPDEELIETLGAVGDEMNSLARTFNETLKKSIDEIEAYRIGTQNQINGVSNEFQKSLEHAVVTFEKPINDFAESVKKLEMGRLAEEMPKFGVAINDISKEISNLKIQFLDITKSLHQFAPDFGRLGDGVKTLAEATIALNQGLPDVKNLNARVENLEGVVRNTENTLNTKLVDLDANFDQLRQQVQDVGTAAQHLKSVFENKSLELIQLLRQKARE